MVNSFDNSKIAQEVTSQQITRRDALRLLGSASAGTGFAAQIGLNLQAPTSTFAALLKDAATRRLARGAPNSPERTALIEAFKQQSEGLQDKFEARTHKSDWTMPYRLFRPAAKGKLPLVVYLSGSGGLGDDNKQIQWTEEIREVKFQSATLTFEHDFIIDIGNREVQVKFLGRGNTPGDAVVYLPKEKIVVAGDLVVYPIPYVYDGYLVEWIQTLENLAHLDADTIVPGHGPVMHDKVYIYLLRDLMKSAVDQMNEKLRQTSPAMNQTLDDVKGGVDLTPFRQRFAGDDKDLGDSFDDAARHLVKLVFLEASLR
jgi:hypothetical protein